MKKLLRFVLSSAFLVFLSAPLHAESYFFLLNRFGYLKMDTKAKTVKLWQTDKTDYEEVYLDGKIESVGDGTYKTPGGTVFKLEKLAKRMVNDGNRGICSGDWKVTVSGDGKEYEKVLGEMQAMASFGEKGSSEFFGEKSK